MASPAAASVIGLLSSFNPEWNNEQLTTMILATSDPITNRIQIILMENWTRSS